MRPFRWIIHCLLPTLHYLDIKRDVALLDHDVISLREYHRGVILKHLYRPTVYVPEFLLQRVSLASGALEPVKHSFKRLPLSVKERRETQSECRRYEVVQVLSVEVSPQE